MFYPFWVFFLNKYETLLSLVHECFDTVSTFFQINKIAIKAVISESVHPRKRMFLNGCHLRKRNESIIKSRVELCGSIILLCRTMSIR
jgi:hypothetical protein